MILQPPSVLVAGPSGTGKTSSLITQLLGGLRVFVVVTEPGGAEVLLDACERLKAPVDNLHWSQCTPNSAGWMDLEDMITKISSMDQKQLSDQRDMGKAAFKPALLKFLSAFRNFHCDRTGRDFGDFTKWDDTCSINVDSLTGWSMLAWGGVVGFKPTANPGEWGIAQNVVFNMLTKINSDRRCFFNLTTHIEKENDDMTGVRKVMVSTIGAKLAPKIPPFFSEVVRSTRRVDKGIPQFNWSTLDDSMDLKNRALPFSATLAANFVPVIEAYRRRKAQAGIETGSLQLSAAQLLAGASPSPAPSGVSNTTPTTPVAVPTATVKPPAAPMGKSN